MASVTAPKAFAVRPARATEGNAMAALALQLGYRCTEQEVRKRLGDMKDTSLYTVFVAVIPEDEVVGWMGAYVYRSVELDPFAEISGLVVNEKLRSRGIGKALLHAAEDWARSAGCAAISVNSNIIRDRAHHFHVSNKYELVKTQNIFRKSLCMRRLLTRTSCITRRLSNIEGRLKSPECQTDLGLQQTAVIPRDRLRRELARS